MEYQRDEHRVHLIVYHLVWTPKRRKPVLKGKVARDCRHLIKSKCGAKGWDILELAIAPDHIHLGDLGILQHPVPHLLGHLSQGLFGDIPV